MSDFPDRVPLDWALIEQVQRKPFLGTLCHEYTRSDLVQRQIAEAVQKERERCEAVIRSDAVIGFVSDYEKSVTAPLQAKLDRVTELVGKWRALVQEDIGLLCGECVTNCADDLEQALKEGEK